VLDQVALDEGALLADVLHQDHRTEDEDEHDPRHQGERLS